MEKLLDPETLPLLVFFVLPGYLSWSVWRIIVPVRTTRLSDSLIAILMLGLLNYILVGWWGLALLREFGIVEQAIMLAGIFVILPVAWPFIPRALISIPFIARRIVHPTPKAWDYFFGLHRPCFVLVRLKNGRLLGGVMDARSFASSYPSPEDMYLEQLWKVTKEGQFLEPLPATRGVLISRSDCDYIQFVKLTHREAQHGKEHETSGVEDRGARISTSG